MTHQLTYQSSSFIGRSLGDRDRYQIEAHLGQGGMGDVYRAIDTRLGKEVAIKLLNTSLSGTSTTVEIDFKRRFERECAICAALKSENVVQVSDYGITTEGQPFYVMEYLAGQTLEQVLKQELKLSIERTIKIVTQICAGLKSAHEGVIFKTPGVSTDRHIKIVHRDLKPANIFLIPTELGERVKIIDFGIAKIQSLHLENTKLTSNFLGTYHYAAPEQFDCQTNIDERSDIYCLGIILYEMLAGVDPFGLKIQGRQVSGESWIGAHLLRSAIPLRSQPGCEHLSVALERLVMRCLEKHPDRRFSSVQALARALDDEQSASSQKMLEDNFTEQHKININHSFNLNLDLFKIKQKFRHIQQWIGENFHFNGFIGQFQILTPPELVSSLQSSPALSRSWSSTPLALSAVNSELIKNCQAELTIYIGPVAELIVEQTLKNDAHYHQAQRFIEALASHIPDADNANCFRQTLLNPPLEP